MSETLSILLVCVFIVLVVDYFRGYGQVRLFTAALVISLLLCIRAVVLPFWLLFVAYFLACWLRDQKRRVWEPLITMTPVVCQLIISFMVTGTPTLSTVGPAGFATWYFPAVYGQNEYGAFIGRKSPEALEGQKRFPELRDKIAYVTKNYGTATKTYLKILIGEHLTAGSNFVRTGTQTDINNRIVLEHLCKWVIYLSRLFACIHAVMLVAMIALVLSGRNVLAEKAMCVCYIFAILLVLPAPLTYLQGDRLILLAAPLWLVAHARLVSLLVDRSFSPVGTFR